MTPGHCSRRIWTRCFLYDVCGMKGESVGLPVYPYIVTRQSFGKEIPAATEN
jgi:hypothetical protein